MRIPIIKYRNAWFALSSVIFIASVVALIVFPLKLGIDFKGGSLMEVRFQNAVDVEEVRALVVDKGYKENIIQAAGDSDMLIRLEEMDETSHQALLADIQAKWDGAVEQRFETVGPTVGDELRRKAVWSILLVLLAICAYIAFAFRKVSRPVSSWKYGIITLIPAIAHDALLPLAVIGVLGHYMMVEVNSAFIAAILTVLSFSVHDSIVIFDRIRENLLKTDGKFEDIVERSVNETLARSINTSLTVFFPMLATFIWGGDSIKWFALTLMIGLIAGTYSSIFLCAPLLVVFQKKAQR